MTPGQLELEDIIIPIGISWWPLATGWWILITSVIIITVATIFIRLRYQKKWRYRKQALKLLEQEYQKWRQQPENMQGSSQAICALLKRTAMSAYPKQTEALFGSKWLTFLNEQTTKKVFSDEVADILCRKQYQTNIDIDIDKLYRSCKQWIKKHRYQPSNIRNSQNPKGEQ